MPISTARRKELTRVRNPMQGAVAGDAGDVPAGARRQWSSMFRAGFRMNPDHELLSLLPAGGSMRGMGM